MLQKKEKLRNCLSDREIKKVEGRREGKVRSQNHRITESQNGRGWKGPLWVI